MHKTIPTADVLRFYHAHPDIRVFCEYEESSGHLDVSCVDTTASVVEGVVNNCRFYYEVCQDVQRELVITHNEGEGITYYEASGGDGVLITRSVANMIHDNMNQEEKKNNSLLEYIREHIDNTVSDVIVAGSLVTMFEQVFPSSATLCGDTIVRTQLTEHVSITLDKTKKSISLELVSSLPELVPPILVCPNLDLSSMDKFINILEVSGALVYDAYWRNYDKNKGGH